MAKCRYCGHDVAPNGTCNNSPNKKHVFLADGKHCVYCGQVFSAGGTCNNSPSKKHQLDT
jgi:hypothetical protein